MLNLVFDELREKKLINPNNNDKYRNNNANLIFFIALIIIQKYQKFIEKYIKKIIKLFVYNVDQLNNIINN